jgi:hypothetical protein
MRSEDRSPDANPRTYQPPKLRIYGGVLELTAAGTGTIKESSGGKESTDTTRQRL